MFTKNIVDILASSFSGLSPPASNAALPMGKGMISPKSLTGAMASVADDKRMKTKASDGDVGVGSEGFTNGRPHYVAPGRFHSAKVTSSSASWSGWKMMMMMMMMMTMAKVVLVAFLLSGGFAVAEAQDVGGESDVAVREGREIAANEVVNRPDVNGMDVGVKEKSYGQQKPITGTVNWYIHRPAFNPADLYDTVLWPPAPSRRVAGQEDAPVTVVVNATEIVKSIVDAKEEAEKVAVDLHVEKAWEELVAAAEIEERNLPWASTLIDALIGGFHDGDPVAQIQRVVGFISKLFTFTRNTHARAMHRIFKSSRDSATGSATIDPPAPAGPEEAAAAAVRAFGMSLLADVGEWWEQAGSFEYGQVPYRFDSSSLPVSSSTTFNVTVGKDVLTGWKERSATGVHGFDLAWAVTGNLVVDGLIPDHALDGFSWPDGTSGHAYSPITVTPLQHAILHGIRSARATIGLGDELGDWEGGALGCLLGGLRVLDWSHSLNGALAPNHVDRRSFLSAFSRAPAKPALSTTLIKFTTERELYIELRGLTLLAHRIVYGLYRNVVVRVLRELYEELNEMYVWHLVVQVENKVEAYKRRYRRARKVVRGVSRGGRYVVGKVRGWMGSGPGAGGGGTGSNNTTSATNATTTTNATTDGAGLE